MTLEDLGNIGEFIGALAVVVSLIYVGFELRQNTKAISNNKNREMLELLHSAFAWLQRPDFAEVVHLSYSDPDALSPVQRLQYEFWFETLLGNWEVAYYNHRSGAMDHDIWQTWDVRMKRELAIAINRAVWARNRDSYGVDFAAHVGQQLAALAKADSSDAAA